MAWFVVLGLISLGLILAGCALAAGRIRRYRHETKARRARAYAEMREISRGRGQGSITEHRESGPGS